MATQKRLRQFQFILLLFCGSAKQLTLKENGKIHERTEKNLLVHIFGSRNQIVPFLCQIYKISSSSFLSNNKIRKSSCNIKWNLRKL